MDSLAVTGIGVTTPTTDDPALLADRPPSWGPQDGSWFDPRTQLGARGYKYLPPACLYLLAATRRAVADCHDRLARTAETARAVAVGTNSAAAALHESMDRTVVEGGSDQLSPALAPFFSINLFASRLSMEHAVKGFNLTVNSPRIAGLEALHVGGRAIRLGRADLLLAGATEAPVPPCDPGAAQAEAGAAVLVVEPAATGPDPGPGYGTVEAHTLFVPPGRLGTAAGWRAATSLIAGTTDRLLGSDGAEPALHLYADGSAVAAALAEGVRAAAAGNVVTELPAGAGCLAPVLRIAGLLHRGQGRHVIAVASAEGTVAFARLLCQPRELANGRSDVGTA